MPSLTKSITHGSDRALEILAELKDRHDLSKATMTTLYDRWAKDDASYMVYTTVGSEDAKRQANREAGVSEYVDLVLPYNYAMLATWHSYMSSVFLGRDPVFQYLATSGDNQSSEQAVEALINYQLVAGRMLPALFVWLHDIGRYGFGCVGRYWTDEQKTISSIQEQQTTFEGQVVVGSTQKVRTTIQVPGYSGNKLYNVRPYDTFPDPRVSFLEQEEGEFMGIYMECGDHKLIEAMDAGLMIPSAVEDLLKNPEGVAQDRYNPGAGILMPNDQPVTNNSFYPGGSPRPGGSASRGANVHGVYRYCVRINAKRWGLSSETKYEKWLFETDVNFSHLLSARPLGTYDQLYPWTLAQKEADPYNLAVRGIPAIGQPFQDTLNWLFNSHMHSVRRSLNDLYLGDPETVELSSLIAPIAGRLILRRPEARGMRPEDILYRIPMQDVTSQNFNDMQAVVEFGQRVFGINDQIMGMLNTGGRKSATEVRTSSTFGVNRLKTEAEWLSCSAWASLAQALLQETQQYYSAEKKLRIVGSLGQFDPQALVNVTPESIIGFYDFVPADGTLPADRFAQANLWREFIAQASRIPQIIQQYDLGQIFAYVAQLSGIKNINKFKIMPQNQINQQVQAGNLVPANPQMFDPGRPPEPGNIGVGATA